MKIQIEKDKSVPASATPYYDVVIVGAGPYGLSAAVHLQERGLKVAIFGKPMGFWRDNMPVGMRMRSYWWATNLSDPGHRYGLAQFARVRGPFEQDPFWLETFVEYGLWFQQELVPWVDETYVAEIKRVDDFFTLLLADGRTVHSKAVVMAVGLGYYAHIPEAYRHLPPDLVSHTMDHHALDRFNGKRVVMIGGGQSAFQTAALLFEQGAQVDVVVRRSMRWVPVQNPKIPALLRQLRAPQAGMGVGWANLIMEKSPYFFHRWPQSTKDYFLRTRHLPAPSPWLKERILGNVSIHTNVQVQAVQVSSEQASVTLSNGETLQADHVMLATGYIADVNRLPMLDSSIKQAIHTYMGYPVLNHTFESSVPGLYFLGFSSQRSFGPLYRFVIGVDAAASGMSRALVRQSTHA